MSPPTEFRHTPLEILMIPNVVMGKSLKSISGKGLCTSKRQFVLLIETATLSLKPRRCRNNTHRPILHDLVGSAPLCPRLRNARSAGGFLGHSRR